MKTDIHPDYNFVVFKDITTDFHCLTKSTIDLSKTKDTMEIDGVEYPVVTIEISSASHPFYTGTQKIMDTEGRVERYYRKYGFANPVTGDEGSDEGEAAGEA